MKNVLLFVLMAFVAVLPIRGEEATGDSLCVNMKSITIVEKRQKAIIIPQMLMSKDLDRIRSQSVADALRFFSGVQVKDYGGIGGIKTVNIRSMGTNHVGVFYNGMQLGNAQNGQVDLGRYSLDNVGADITVSLLSRDVLLASVKSEHKSTLGINIGSGPHNAPG